MLKAKNALICKDFARAIRKRDCPSFLYLRSQTTASGSEPQNADKYLRALRRVAAAAMMNPEKEPRRERERENLPVVSFNVLTSRDEGKPFISRSLSLFGASYLTMNP